jgi:hypothetical protein
MTTTPICNDLFSISGHEKIKQQAAGIGYVVSENQLKAPDFSNYRPGGTAILLTPDTILTTVHWKISHKIFAVFNTMAPDKLYNYDSPSKIPKKYIYPIVATVLLDTEWSLYKLDRAVEDGTVLWLSPCKIMDEIPNLHLENDFYLLGYTTGTSTFNYVSQISVISVESRFLHWNCMTIGGDLFGSPLFRANGNVVGVIMPDGKCLRTDILTQVSDYVYFRLRRDFILDDTYAAGLTINAQCKNQTCNARIKNVLGLGKFDQSGQEVTAVKNRTCDACHKQGMKIRSFFLVNCVFTLEGQTHLPLKKPFTRVGKIGGELVKLDPGLEALSIENDNPAYHAWQSLTITTTDPWRKV